MSNYTYAMRVGDSLLFPDDGHSLVCVYERRSNSHPNGGSYGNPRRYRWHNQIESVLANLRCCGQVGRLPTPDSEETTWYD